MNTRFETLSYGEEDAKIYKEAGRIIKEGGLVAFPTETVYGLGGDALNPEASSKIYAAKGRPSDNPLIVHITELEALYEIISSDIPDETRALIRKLSDAFWPGPLTMVLPKNERVPYETTGGLDTVAVRMPRHSAALNFIKEGGGYIAAPSANTSGRPSPTKAEHVRQDLDGRIDMIIDGGDVGIGVESTIVDLTGEVPMLLRPGYINLSMLSEVVGKVLIDPALEGEAVRPKAPGMKYKHYAPKGELYIVSGKNDHVVSAIKRFAKESLKNGEKVGIIATEENLSSYDKGIVKCVGSRADEETIARHLFAVLREFDDMGVSRIYSESLDTPRMGMAVMNRLLKAAAHRVIEAEEELI